MGEVRSCSRGLYLKITAPTGFYEQPLYGRSGIKRTPLVGYSKILYEKHLCKPVLIEIICTKVSCCVRHATLLLTRLLLLSLLFLL